MASSFIKKSVEEIFCSATLTIQPTEVNDSIVQPTSSIVKISQSEYSTSAYFRDATSKRSKVAVPLVITFANEFERKKMLKSGAIQPAPVDIHKQEAEQVAGKEEKDLWGAELDNIGETQGDELENLGKVELKFECFCKDDGLIGASKSETHDNGGTVIEGIKILSTSLIDSNHLSAIRFDVEIAVRSIPALSQDMKETYSEITNRSNELEVDLQKRSEADMAKARLGIRATLISRNDGPEQMTHSSLSHQRKGGDKDQPALSLDHELQLGLQALDMGIEAISPYDLQDDLGTASYFSKSRVYSLPDKTEQATLLRLDILPAFLVSVREVSAATSNASPAPRHLT